MTTTTICCPTNSNERAARTAPDARRFLDIVRRYLRHHRGFRRSPSNEALDGMHQARSLNR